MKRTLVFAALVFAAPASADGPDCKNPMDQHTMNHCAGLAYEAADAKLNAAYAKLKAAQSEDGFKVKLRDAQRAWIQFRDKHCTYEAAENEGGSIYPLVYSGCLTRLTRDRTNVLEQLAACQKDAEKCQ